MAEFIEGTVALDAANKYDSGNSTGISKAIGDALNTKFGDDFQPGIQNNHGKTGIEGLAAALVAAMGPVVVPIGGIIWWAPHVTGVPALPSGFVECNGQTLSDTESPLNGEIMPDINDAADGRFIRGTNAATTGTTQADQNLSHSHTISPNPHGHQVNVSGLAGATGLSTTARSSTVSGQATSTTSLTIGNDGGGEARPKNIALRAIIRVK
jgi:hypothetical protein